MKILTIDEANSVLSGAGMKLGAWNEIVGELGAAYVSFQPPDCGRFIFKFVEKTLEWMEPKTWLFVQFDNSTSPLDGQASVLDSLIGRAPGTWDIGHERSFIFENLDESSRTKVVLLTYFSILFEWHIHVVSADELRRISVQDGVIYFIGSDQAVADGRALISTSTAD